MRSDLDPGVNDGKGVTGHGSSNSFVEQDRFRAMAGIVLGVEHRAITRKYELPVDVGRDGNYGRGDCDTCCQRGEVFLKRSHCAAMITKSDWKQNALATHGPVKVRLERLQPSDRPRYNMVIRRVVASDGDVRKF
jgi:hypothetical protein